MELLHSYLALMNNEEKDSIINTLLCFQVFPANMEEGFK